jgi:diapolycopene oxygenase
VDVIVIGAGVGGLSAAVRLAARGCKVKVIERLPRVGGKLNLLEDAGFTFDTGPSLFTLPWVFEELFAAAGERLSDHLELIRLEPVCRYFYPDGSGFDASADMPTMMQNLERFSKGAGEDFNAFFGHAARAWRGSRVPFLESAISGPLDFVKNGVPWQDLSALLPLPTLHGLAARYFKDKRLQQFIGRYATYTGSSPYKAPGTLSTVLYSEYAFGAWYINGGLYKLASSLELVARKLGVEFEFERTVEKIYTDDDGVQLNRKTEDVKGVLLDDGRVIQCDAVVCNADAAHLYESLLLKRLDARKQKLEPSISGFVMLLGVEGETPNLEHHNIFFSSDYKLEFKQIFGDLQPASEPTIYVCISSKSDAAQAPAGHENWFVLVNAPPTGNVDWSSVAPQYAERILELLAKRGVDIRNRIKVQHLMTPDDLESRYLTHRGGIYGSSSNTVSSAFLRPQNRSGTVKGLYLASGSAHPGGGLPLVALSGKLAAEALLEDFRVDLARG